MKVAIARSNGEAAQHFGHCDDFMLFDIENQVVSGQTVLQNPGHTPGFLPGYLHEHGVDVIIAGGMGQKARDLFAMNNIETITGLSGTVEEVLNAYLNNTLDATNETCKHEHDDDHTCDH